MALIGTQTTLKGTVGFKGEKGESAYQVAVRNGFIGTEKDWLATLGTTNYVGETKATFVGSQGQKEFGLPTSYTSESIVEVYIEGEKLNANEYTLDSTNRTLTLTNAISVNGTTVEVVLLAMASYELPIVETINASSTNDTAAGTKAVYNFVNSSLTPKLNKSNIQVLTGSVSGIGAGATLTTDINYPSGFTKSNTLIVGKMTSSNNVYYDSLDLADTTNGFPRISMVALMDTGIRIWLKNTNTSEARVGHYKITLMRLD
jgi:hypothetical protein